jgi:DNA-binding XRE family transcriptional regulator
VTGTELAAARKAAEFARQDLAKKLNLSKQNWPLLDY